jgi:hypothetical protein
MLEKLISAAEQRADLAVERQIDRLAETPAPPGVTVEPFDSGVRLTGKRLRRRLITDPSLRNFGR